MNYIKTITLSIIILIFCIVPVVSAEINEYENNTGDLNAYTPLNNNILSRIFPNLKILMDESFYQGDDIAFEITSTSYFEGPLKISIDDIYHTTVWPKHGYVSIKIFNLDIAPGNHKLYCEFDGDDKYFYEARVKDFTIKEK